MCKRDQPVKQAGLVAAKGETKFFAGQRRPQHFEFAKAGTEQPFGLVASRHRRGRTFPMRQGSAAQSGDSRAPVPRPGLPQAASPTPWSSPSCRWACRAQRAQPQQPFPCIAFDQGLFSRVEQARRLRHIPPRPAGVGLPPARYRQCRAHSVLARRANRAVASAACASASRWLPIQARAKLVKVPARSACMPSSSKVGSRRSSSASASGMRFSSR